MVYVDDIKKADIVIFDTCSVRQKSEDKIFGKMLEIEKHQKVWMTWCMVQHYLRNTKIKKAKTWSIAKLAQGNFVGNVKENDPVIIGFWDFREELKNIDNILLYVILTILFLSYGYINQIFSQILDNLIKKNYCISSNHFFEKCLDKHFKN